MKKHAIIEIKSTQKYDDTEDDSISLITEGMFYKKNDKYYIKYDESDMSGIEDTKTTLKLDGDVVTLIRTGANPTQMIFKKDEHHVGLYNTVAGPYTLGVKTKEIKSNFNDLGGSLNLEYEIELNYQMSGYNTFNLKIKTDKEETNELYWFM